MQLHGSRWLTVHVGARCKIARWKIALVVYVLHAMRCEMIGLCENHQCHEYRSELCRESSGEVGVSSTAAENFLLDWQPREQYRTGQDRTERNQARRRKPLVYRDHTPTVEKAPLTSDVPISSVVNHWRHCRDAPTDGWTERHVYARQSGAIKPAINNAGPTSHVTIGKRDDS